MDNMNMYEEDRAHMGEDQEQSPDDMITDEDAIERKKVTHSTL
jgi:hypothetical protein